MHRTVLLSLLILGFFTFDQDLYSQIPDLEVLIQSALQSSDEIRLQEEEVKRTQIELKNAKTFYWPRLSLQGSIGVDLLELGEFSTDRNLGSDLILDWDFFQNGLVKYRIEQANAQYKMSLLDLENLRLEIYFRIQLSFFDLVEKRENIRLMQGEFAHKGKFFERVEIEVNQGRRPRGDLLKERANLLDDEIRLKRSERELFYLIKKLEDRTGYTNIIKFNLDLDDFDFKDIWNQSQLIAWAIESRVDIKKNKIIMQLAHKAYRVAKWKRWPQINLFAGNAFALDDLGSIDNRFQFRTGLIARYPIYDGGQTTLQIAVAKLHLKRAELKVEQDEKKIETEVEEAWDEVHYAEDMLKLSILQSEIMQDDFDRAKIALDHKEMSAYEWEEAKLSFERIKARQMTFKLNFLRALSGLARVIGKIHLE